MRVAIFVMKDLCLVIGCALVLLIQPASKAAIVDPTRLPAASTATVEFERDVQPIFSRHCYSCHGPDKQKGEFRLDVKAKALAGGDSGESIIAGRSAESPLIHMVAGLVEDKVMPQKGERLTATQIGILRAWIDQGATWPEHLSAAPLQTTNFWAFRALSRPAPPATGSNSRSATPLDRFILARMEAVNLSPAPPADKATLLRRVTFDLLGMPPTPGELEAFLADQSTNAFATVVDRLLASPHYGERWARHWLDLARFSESDGFEFDKMREQAWPYRDYLVRSFNQDKPYAQFIREQIAGDAIEPVTRDGIVATGFLTAGPFDEAGNTSVSASLKARIREEEMEDMIAGVSQTFVAMTVNCARCHDHKFDPIPQQDYYRLKAALDGVRHGNRPWLTPDETRARESEVTQLNNRVAQLEKKLNDLEQSVRESILSDRANNQSTVNAEPGLEKPFARWTFEKDAQDSAGKLHAGLVGGARIERGRLILDGKGAFARTDVLAQPLREKTFEVWATLSSLAQRGGGLISLETKENGVFDAIVFGERVPKKWMAGSSSFQRSRDLTAPDEEAKPGTLVHVAIVYRTNNSISVFRNGLPYGETYTPTGDNGSLQTFSPREARVLLGLRHTGAGNGFFAGEIEEARLYDRALSDDEILRSARQMDSRIVTSDELTQAMTPAQRQERESLVTRISEARNAVRGLVPVQQVYAAVSRQPEPTFVLVRGDIEKRKGTATAGGLSAVSMTADFGLPATAPEAHRRIKLAEWIASPKNPLTWRVMVNRVWHHHFGRGLVGTPNDFGVNGERPSHPELLDWLASEFIAQGGSLKKLHRLILLSATYQQASAGASGATDADNRLLSHFPLRRLEAEAVRDAMLSVSGQLNPEMGGPGFRPFKVTVSGSHFYEITDPIGPAFNRRTLYRMNVQSGKDPLLDSLDCPDPSTKTPARNVTTTPIQSLGLMNSAFVQRQCRHFAQRLVKEAGDDLTSQIQLAYRLAFSRDPNPEEASGMRALARTQGLESACWVLLNASEFIYVR